jgi:hypothetical protein
MSTHKEIVLFADDALRHIDPKETPYRALADLAGLKDYVDPLLLFNSPSRQYCTSLFINNRRPVIGERFSLSLQDRAFDHFRDVFGGFLKSTGRIILTYEEVHNSLSKICDEVMKREWPGSYAVRTVTKA